MSWGNAWCRLRASFVGMASPVFRGNGVHVHVPQKMLACLQHATAMQHTHRKHVLL